MEETKFKQTDIGRIPEDWEVNRMGNISSSRMYGVSAPAINFDGKTRYIRITDIDDFSYKYVPNPLTTPLFYEDRHVVAEDDLLIARTGASVGKTYLYNKADGKLVFAGFLMKFHVDKALSAYVFLQTQIARYKTWVKSESARTGQPGINIKQFESFLLPLPPLAEQERIASALTAADNLIASLDKQIEKTRNLKQATMQHLLSSLPNHSPLKPLGEVAEIIRGVRVVTSNLIPNGKYPVVSGGTGYMGYLNTYNREPNTITIAQYGTAGYVKWQEQKFWANDVCFCVKPDIKLIENKYLYYTLANLQEYLYSISNRDATPYSIDRNKILETRIPIPPIEEQERIASILTAMDNQIAALEKKRSKYEMVKQGMMQQLLTGTIRLI